MADRRTTLAVLYMTCMWMSAVSEDGQHEYCVAPTIDMTSADDLLTTVSSMVQSYGAIMETGDPDLDLPVQDPLYFPTVDDEYDTAFFSCTSRTVNVTFVGMSNYSVVSVQVEPEKGLYQFGLMFPDVKSWGTVKSRFVYTDYFAYTFSDDYDTHIVNSSIIVNARFEVTDDGEFRTTWVRADLKDTDSTNFTLRNSPAINRLVARFDALKPIVMDTFQIHLGRELENNIMKVFQNDYFQRMRPGIVRSTHC